MASNLGDISKFLNNPCSKSGYPPKIPDKILTHSGLGHLDDKLGSAILYALNEGIKIRRERFRNAFDYRILSEKGYALLDVGGIFDPSKYMFDHHQENSPVRPNGIPFATAGLVWETFGELLCSGNKNLVSLMDKRLFQFVDFKDNGGRINLGTKSFQKREDRVEEVFLPLTLSEVGFSYNYATSPDDQNFNLAVKDLSLIIKNYINKFLNAFNGKGNIAFSNSDYTNIVFSTAIISSSLGKDFQNIRDGLTSNAEKYLVSLGIKSRNDSRRGVNYGLTGTVWNIFGQGMIQNDDLKDSMINNIDFRIMRYLDFIHQNNSEDKLFDFGNPSIGDKKLNINFLPVSLNEVVSSFDISDNNFNNAVYFAKNFLKNNLLEVEKYERSKKEIIDAVDKQGLEKGYLVLPFEVQTRIVGKLFPRISYVIYPKEGQIRLRTARRPDGSEDSIPKEFCDLKNNENYKSKDKADIEGINFIHKGRFAAGADTMDAMISFVEKCIYLNKKK